MILFQGFGDSSINHEFRVWTKTENFLDLKNSIPVEIKEAFDERGIEIPFPHRTLYTGSVTEPLPIRFDGQTGGVDGPQPTSDPGESGRSENV